MEGVAQMGRHQLATLNHIAKMRKHQVYLAIL